VYDSPQIHAQHLRPILGWTENPAAGLYSGAVHQDIRAAESGLRLR
jgi:hypothetical protein